MRFINSIKKNILISGSIILKSLKTLSLSLSLSLSLIKRCLCSILLIAACWIVGQNNCNAVTTYINNLHYQVDRYDRNDTAINPPPYNYTHNQNVDYRSTHNFNSSFNYYINNASSGDIIILSTDNTKNTLTNGSPTSNWVMSYETYHTYTSATNWAPNANHTSGGIIYNTAGTLTIQNDRSGATGVNGYFVDGLFTHSGSGNLTLSNVAADFDFDKFTGSGSGGTITVNNTIKLLTGTGSLTTDNTTVGAGTSKITGFTSNILGMWEANDLVAINFFNLTGTGNGTSTGITTATSTTISGTTDSSITHFNTNTSGTLTVGNGTNDGIFNIISGSAVVSNGIVNIATSSHAGTVNLTSGSWNTNNEVNVGTIAGIKGEVNVAANQTWTAIGTINIASTVAGSIGEVNLVGNLTATNQVVNVGQYGTGTFNQTNGNWINKETRVGVLAGSTGKINQSGGDHKDQLAIIGQAGNGEAKIHNGATWETISSTTAGNAAIISQSGNSKGVVEVYDTSTWTIGSSGMRDNLITADEAGSDGYLHVYTDSGAGTVTVWGNHIIADDRTNDVLYSKGKDEVEGAGSTLTVHGNMTTARQGDGELHVHSAGETTVDGNHIIADEEDSTGYDHVNDAGSLLNVKGDLITARSGTGRLDVYDHAAVTVGTTSVRKDHIIADLLTGYGTDRIYGEATLDVTKDLITGNAGKAQLKVYTKGVVTVDENHVVANAATSYGSDQIDGNGSELIVLGNMTVGEYGQAGGRYVYHPEGESGYLIYPDTTAGNYLGGGDYLDPTKNSNIGFDNKWFGSPNLDLRPTDTGWSDYETDAPGLAITAGGLVTVGTIAARKDATVAAQQGSYAYILLDNWDNEDATLGQSTWTITNNLIMGGGTLDKTADVTDDDAYMRIINGAIVMVDKDATVGNKAGYEVTVRVNGLDQEDQYAQFNVGDNLFIAKGTDNGTFKTEGNLYVYDKGQVKVGNVGLDADGGNLTIAEENNAYGRVQVDGIDSKITVDGLLTVANKGTAGSIFEYTANNGGDDNPNNDNLNDPSALQAQRNKWFDSDNTLTDLTDNTDPDNKNAPGLLITRGAVVTSQAGNVATEQGSYAYIVIDGKDQGTSATERSRWTVTGGSNDGAIEDGNLIIGDDGTAYMRIFNGGLLETTSIENGEGNITIARDAHSVSTVRVFGSNDDGTKSRISSSKNLTVAEKTGSNGQLYIYSGAEGEVGANMTIADKTDSNAQVQVDGKDTTLKVTERLTVGNFGNAGAYYNENRYDTGYLRDPSESDNTPNLIDNLYDPTHVGTSWWFASANMNLRDNPNFAGNAPGLAITDGALVESGSGVVGSEENTGVEGIGYVVIDNRYGFYDADHVRSKSDRSTWHVITRDINETTQNGDLIIGREGQGFVRVLNGALLEVDGYTKLNSQIVDGDNAYNSVGVGSLYVFGNGGMRRATPNTATADYVPVYTTKEEEGYVIPYADGNRTTWISKKATVLGDTGTQSGGDATIRIDNGAYGETHGIYAGYSVGSRGSVSVMGMGSELHIYKDEYGDQNYNVNQINGSGSLSVSNHALLQLHEEANITLNGMSIISHNSLLHLDKDSIIDSRAYSSKIVNARVEGIGTITAQNGVKFLYDPTYTPSNIGDPVYKYAGEEDSFKFVEQVSQFTSTQIDPGLHYGWDSRDEYYDRYGTLTFGDQLSLVGNVTTLFDVNSGWPSTDVPDDGKGNPVPDGIAGQNAQEDNFGNIIQMNDLILVQRTQTAPTGTANITASMSGTLKIHARLTGYFGDDPTFEVVRTIGDDKSGQFVSGKVTRMFDKLEVVPWRFFETPHQEIRDVEVKSGAFIGETNESLYVSMKLKKNPFEEAGITYNQKSTGAALDSIYALRKDDWLPVLRYFWYLGDPAFLDAYKSFTGEIRAHSLLMPFQSPWTYNQNRYDFRPCPDKSHRHGYDRPDFIDPCEMSKLANNVDGCNSLLERLKRCWNRCKKDVRIWGDLLYEQAEYDSDGNASAFKIVRNGGVVGIDKPTKNGKQFFGFQFAFAESELDTYLAEAKAADFNFGVYHSRKIHNVFEWRNYLGMGIQDYKTKRSITSGISNYQWVWNDPNQISQTDPNAGYYALDPDKGYNGMPRSSFRGYTFYANTELARPFILGTCKQYMIKPFAAVDVIGTWQNSAHEYGDFTNAHLVRLDFHTASNIRTFARTGLTLERNGDYTNLHAGLSYNFQLGGRHYTNVNNQFQFGGDQFNIRSVDTGNDFLNLNCGTEIYLGHKRNQFIMLNYQALFGKNITAQNAQIGYQYKF